MSTLLQRMARRARESPLEATPRIDPVLAPSFWPGALTSEDGAIEEHREREARAPALRKLRVAPESPESPESPEPFEPTGSSVTREPPVLSIAPVARETAEASGDVRPAHAGEISPARAATLSRMAARHAAQEPAAVARAPSEVQADAQAIKQGVAQALPQHHTGAKIEPLLDATPTAATAAREGARNTRRSEDAPSSRRPERHIADHPALPHATAATTPFAAPHAAPALVAAAPDTPAPAAPTVTISFGRVEVRQASAPPTPPRAPFRPAVSLDAFLRRGGGNTR